MKNFFKYTKNIFLQSPKETEPGRPQGVENTDLVSERSVVQNYTERRVKKVMDGDTSNEIISEEADESVRENTEPLNQRISVLESANQELTKKIESLESRITDSSGLSDAVKTLEANFGQIENSLASLHREIRERGVDQSRLGKIEKDIKDSQETLADLIEADEHDKDSITEDITRITALEKKFEELRRAFKAVSTQMKNELDNLPTGETPQAPQTNPPSKPQP